MASLNSSKISLSQKIGFMHICFIVVDPNTLNLDPDPGGNFFIKKNRKKARKLLITAINSIF